jgi:hypothetical protein
MKHKRTEAEAARVIRFLAKLRANWGKRFSDDETEQEWLGMMIQELGFYNDSVLDRATSRLMHSKIDFFPRLQQCAEACADVVADDARKSPDFFMPQHGNVAATSIFAPERQRLADDLIMSNVGRTAAHEGWILGLRDFCVRHARMPDDRETAVIKRAAAEHPHAVERVANGPDGLFRRPLLVIAETMAEREQVYADRVLGRKSA